MSRAIRETNEIPFSPEIPSRRKPLLSLEVDEGANSYIAT